MALSRDKAEGRPPLPAIEAGTYAVRLCRVYDLGIQQGEWKGEKKRGNQIYVIFEFTDQFMPGENGVPNTSLPRVSGKFIKLYRNAEKGIEYEFCRALDPAGTYNGDWAAMVRARLPALATVIVNEKGRDQIDSLAGIPRGFNIPEGIVEIQTFDLDNPDKAVWDKIPAFIKTKISERIRDEDLPPVKYQRTEAEAKVSPEEVGTVGTDGSITNENTEVSEDDVPW
jgi:hypothetical protein